MSYAQKNGYHFQLIRHNLVNDRNGAWSKMVVAKELLKSGRFDWVWMLDLDTVITNHDIRLEGLIPHGAWYSTLSSPPEDLEQNRIAALVAFDCNGFNSGSLLLRADQWTLTYLDEAYEVGAKTSPAYWNDQRGFAVAYNSKAENRIHFGIISQNKLNAYEVPCVGPDSTTWKHGDFVVHFAGFKGFKGDMTAEYMEKRVGVFVDGVDVMDWSWLDVKRKEDRGGTVDKDPKAYVA